MSRFYIAGIDEAFAETVRETMRSPGYGHAATREIAKGTGPCRVCLQRFDVGQDERILFTFRSPAAGGSIGAPGPVFIHADRCARYRSDAFPADLHSLPIILEGHAGENRIPFAVSVPGTDADAALLDLFGHADVEYVNIRHGEAGCYIARAERNRAWA